MTLIPSGTDTPSENSMNAGISVPVVEDEPMDNAVAESCNSVTVAVDETIPVDVPEEEPEDDALDLEIFCIGSPINQKNKNLHVRLILLI
jgi:hypothetical protein